MKNSWVIKAGGDLLTRPIIRKKMWRDLTSLSRRHPIVFVHGGGPQIETALKKNRIPNRFVEGRRVTSQKAMRCIESILSGHVNKKLVSELRHMGVNAVGCSGRDGGMVIGKTIPKLGRAAKPSKVHPGLIQMFHRLRAVPVISSVASDSHGEAVNINADDFTSALAQALKAAHLIYMTDTSGVNNSHGKRIQRLSLRRIPSLIKSRTITAGMIPKVQSATLALKKGVKEVNIVNGTVGIKLHKGTKIVH